MEEHFLSLRAKTNVVISFVLIALAVMGVFSFRESRRLANKDFWVAHTRDVLELSQSLRSHLADTAAARRAYISGNSANLNDFNSASNTVLLDLAALRKLTADNPEQQARLDELEPLVRARLSFYRESIEIHQQNPDDRKAQDAFADQGTSIATQFASLIHEFENVERSLLQERTAEAESSERRATRINETLSFSVFVFLIVMLGVLNRELDRRSRTDRAASDQRSLLESILNCCSDAIIVVDRSGKTILSNPAAVRLHSVVPGTTLSEAWPRTLGLYRPDKVSLFPLEDLPLAHALRGELVDGMEIYVRPPGKHEGRYVLAAGRPLVNEMGERQGGLVLLRDITERKRSDEELNAALKESESISRERTELSNLADLFQSCQTVEGACRVSESVLPAIFDLRPGALYLINASRNLAEATARWNHCATTEDAFDPQECWALRLGKPYSVADPKTPMRCSHVPASFTGNYLCVPLVAQGETLGVFYLEDTVALAPDTTPNHWQNLLRRAGATADRISLALANLKLREVLRNQSIRDPLTGLFNRRYLEETLNREVHRAARTKRSISAVMLDLDYFKRFNDGFGHQAGDMLLKEIASVIQARVRAGDLACRYGGEEFALILFETDMTGAHKCVETIREAIKHLTLQYRGGTLDSVTISAGIASFPAHGDNPDDIMRAADDALYRAKKAGRDRIVTCQVIEPVSQLS
jgi:diguanylate cyclase (GGDEF)-like protein